MIVYKVTSPSNKIYIGITVETLERRKQYHISTAKRKSRNAKFQKAILKYENNLVWEVIDTANSHEELCQKEIYYIQYFDSYNTGYNCTLGGEGNFGWKPSEEVKNKIRLAQKGRILTEEHKLKLAKAKLGKKYGKREKTYKMSIVFNLIDKYTNEILGTWNNISECARFLNVHPASINKCVKNQSYYKNYKFEIIGKA